MFYLYLYCLACCRYSVYDVYLYCLACCRYSVYNVYLYCLACCRYSVYYLYLYCLACCRYCVYDLYLYCLACCRYLRAVVISWPSLRRSSPSKSGRWGYWQQTHYTLNKKGKQKLKGYLSIYCLRSAKIVGEGNVWGNDCQYTRIIWQIYSHKICHL